MTCPKLVSDDKIQLVSQLNDELRNIQQKVVRSLWQVIPCLGPFYGIFVFDIIGDATSMKDAIFAPIILVITSVVIYLIPYLYIANETSIDDRKVSPDDNCET